MNQSHHEPDAMVVASVEEVANRFGPQGLSDLIALAQVALAEAEAAMRELDSSDDTNA